MKVVYKIYFFRQKKVSTGANIKDLPKGVGNKKLTVGNVKSKAAPAAPAVEVPSNIPASKYVWLCLRCGAQNCGGPELQNEKSHAKFHYQVLNTRYLFGR